MIQLPKGRGRNRAPFVASSVAMLQPGAASFGIGLSPTLSVFPNYWSIKIFCVPFQDKSTFCSPYLLHPWILFTSSSRILPEARWN